METQRTNEDFEREITSIRELAGEANQLKRRNSWVEIVVKIAAICALGAVFGARSGFFTAMFGSLLGSLLLMPFASKKQNRVKAIRKQLHAIEDRMIATEDGRALPVLLEMRAFSNSSLNKMTFHVLPKLLPLVREEHAPLYSAASRAYLRRAMSAYRRKSPQDRAALIRAIGQIGDADCAAMFEKILRQIEDKEAVATRYDGLEDDIRAALATLKARLERERMSDVLLRASVAPAAPETLLRPAANTMSDSSELLRAANEAAERRASETVPLSQKISE